VNIYDSGIAHPCIDRYFVLMRFNLSTIQTFCTIGVFILVTLSGCTSAPQRALYATDTHVSLGIVYLQQGNFENARLILNQVITQDPQAPLGWAAIAYLDEITGNDALAEKEYRHAIFLAPSQGEWHNNYGVFLCHHHQFRTGITEILTAAQSPSYIYRATAYKNAGLCALKIPDRNAAKQYFAAAARNEPKKG
jgi:type IV pilus assembly protein PilF